VNIQKLIIMATAQETLGLKYLLGANTVAYYGGYNWDWVANIRLGPKCLLGEYTETHNNGYCSVYTRPKELTRCVH
jgi:hypothetical protein